MWSGTVLPICPDPGQGFRGSDPAANFFSSKCGVSCHAVISGEGDIGSSLWGSGWSVIQKICMAV